MVFSFAFTHALRARRRIIYAPLELYNNAHGNARQHIYLYYGP